MSASPFIPAQARLAGLLYLVIIVAGLWGEGIARGGLTTAEAIRQGAGLCRLALTAAPAGGLPASPVSRLAETAFALWLLARAGRSIPAAIATAPH